MKDAIYDVVVIGGGPAGMMAAGRAVERGLKVVLLEKNAKLGEKLLITGGGRCNVTNAEFDDHVLLAKFKDSAKFLYSAFSQHGVKESLDFFESRDMRTKVEENKRVFPVTDKAESVWKVLIENMKDTRHGGKNPVNVISNAEVKGFLKNTEGSIVGVKLKNGDTISGKSFILATGGKSHPETGSTGDGFKWLETLGHTVVAPRAALVPITTSDAWTKEISGVALADAKMTIFQNGIKVSGKQGVKRGKILFTHFGLSGPAILNMSSEIRELLKYGEVIISLDLLPDHDHSTLNKALQELFASENTKKFKNAITKLIPKAFVPIILETSGIDEDVTCNGVTRENRMKLIEVLKGLPLHPTGLLGDDKAIITSGGIDLTEVDFRTMSSKKYPNLYLVGDILNIDRPSGGYSLQLCWTTGWVAGNSVLASR